MKTYKIAHTDLIVSRIGYGCGSLGGEWDRELVSADAVENAVRLVKVAYENGITLFDHADVYAYGKAETAFGEVLKRSPGLRNKIIIQSKCGIHLSWPIQEPPPYDPHRMDFSCNHIVSAVEGSLRRLYTDHLDILLLHRPDALVDPDEVAKAFETLRRSGKVRYFGVSNHSAAQIELLKKSVREPLVVNQVQIGLGHSYMIADGIDFNRAVGTRLMNGYVGAAGNLDYYRLHDIRVQAWSPLRAVPLGTLNADATPQTQQFAYMLDDVAKQNNTTASAVALAWLLRHPAGIIPIIGATRTEHVVENCAADRTNLTSAQWYALLEASTGLPSQKML